MTMSVTLVNTSNWLCEDVEVVASTWDSIEGKPKILEPKILEPTGKTHMLVIPDDADLIIRVRRKLRADVRPNIEDGKQLLPFVESGWRLPK